MLLSRLSLLGGLLLLALAGVAKAEAPEPPDYWTGPMQGDVPATLAGGRVLHTDSLADLLRIGGVVLIDVAEPPHRPANLAPDAIWKPSHQNIAGSVWLPGVGAGKLEDSLSDFFRERLKTLSSGDVQRPLVFYCHQNCWGSWNAAKRAISFGCRNVSWYPAGVEGWQDAGRPLATAQPETPSQAAR
ncbi:rhodanese-like domain-containing protein [Methylocapsa polymorpha]|uniref:Rhodanese-like domain-containing protein n=1 Tax=Methylocapsa polymorpha TaxID=3080828 RepID=A0ABZ0HPL3_9HYPH|nr:rhodanese-like domain-containing protein [Methylocapsa sp. RX1]